MGMDVYGKNPRSKKGKYFRNTVWYWHPLWDYCQHVAPTITSHVKHGHSNDCDGLDDELSRKLADILQEEIASGRTKEYAVAFQREKDNLPDDECMICAGTGKRKSPPQIGAGDYPCNGC